MKEQAEIYSIQRAQNRKLTGPWRKHITSNDRSGKNKTVDFQVPSSKLSFYVNKSFKI